MSDYLKPLTRSREKPKHSPGPLIAYDLETTPIPENTGDPLSVEPLYFTAWGKSGLLVSQKCETFEEVHAIVREFWTWVDPRTRFVAWNANRFDLRLIMAALTVYGSRFKIEPFVAKQAGLRGARVRRGDLSCFFLDAMAMLGMQCNLRTFLEAFAPDYPKGRLDLSKVRFDPTNAKHVAYAERDAQGLYHGIVAAERIAKSVAHFPLQVTIGQLGIKAAIAELPKSVVIYALPNAVYRQVREVAVRGGYVYARRFRGRAWSYDNNQAYGAAMRDCDLPCGRLLKTVAELPALVGIYRGVLSRSPRSPIPYVVRTQAGEAFETIGAPIDTFLCSNEVAMLRSHGWRFDIAYGYVWESRFRFKRLVTRLETLRKEFESGTPVNQMAKYIGCNAYGKFLESGVPGKYVFSWDPPKGGAPLCDEFGEPLDFLWVVPQGREARRWYSRPQIGAFITAHVRGLVFDAAMADPKHFLKADTDSVTFSRPQPHLRISKWEYGAWKCESAGQEHIIITKKVYRRPGHVVCKGLRVRQLRKKDFIAWFQTRRAPRQTQVQLVTWKKGRLAPTYRFQERKGTEKHG